jgi:uncharacterized membrane protein
VVLSQAQGQLIIIIIIIIIVIVVVVVVVVVIKDADRSVNEDSLMKSIAVTLNSCIITRFSGNNYISDSVIRHLL